MCFQPIMEIKAPCQVSYLFCNTFIVHKVNLEYRIRPSKYCYPSTSHIIWSMMLKLGLSIENGDLSVPNSYGQLWPLFGVIMTIGTHLVTPLQVTWLELDYRKHWFATLGDAFHFSEVLIFEIRFYATIFQKRVKFLSLWRKTIYNPYNVSMKKEHI